MCPRCYKVFGNLNELREHQLYTCPVAKTPGSKVKTAVESTTAMGDFLPSLARPKPDAVIVSRYEGTRAKKTGKEEAEKGEIKSDMEALNDMMQKLNKH